VSSTLAEGLRSKSCKHMKRARDTQLKLHKQLRWVSRLAAERCARCARLLRINKPACLHQTQLHGVWPYSKPQLAAKIAAASGAGLPSMRPIPFAFLIASASLAFLSASRCRSWLR
jgi:hypothetical protein